MFWVYLAGQFVCGMATVFMCWRITAPKNDALRALWRDVWLPLLLVLPFFGFVPVALPDVNGVGWVPLGGPIAVGWSCVVAALFVGQLRHNTVRIDPGDAVFWALAGAVLLLLGAAHELHIWVGQCALALGAILLWRNTPTGPTSQDHATDTDHSEMQRENAALGVAVLFALAHAVLMWLTVSTAMGEAVSSTVLTGIVVGASMLIAITSALALVVGLANRYTDMELTRLGGWAGTYGVLLAIGLFSLVGLLPQTFQTLAGRGIGNPQLHVAYGFGRYGLEATLLLVLAIWTLARATGAKPAGPAMRRSLGVIIGAGLAGLVAWRVLAAVGSTP